MPTGYCQWIAVATGPTAKQRAHGHGRCGQQHQQLTPLGQGQAKHRGPLKQPMLQHPSRQPEAKDAAKTEQQAHPTHWIDQFG